MFTIHIDFPGFLDFVAWLQARDQAQIDKLTEQLVEANIKFQKSAAALKTAVETVPQ